jgi:hypothetical protein
MAGLTRWPAWRTDDACGNKVCNHLLCADVGAPRQHPRTINEKYRSAEGKNADYVSPNKMTNGESDATLSCSGQGQYADECA